MFSEMLRFGKELELLKDDPNSGARRLACRLELDGNSVEQNASRSRLGDTSQNFHQGRLARSVLPNEHVDRSLMNGEIDLIECQGAWITLGDLFGENDHLVPIGRGWLERFLLTHPRQSLLDLHRRYEKEPLRARIKGEGTQKGDRFVRERRGSNTGESLLHGPFVHLFGDVCII